MIGIPKTRVHFIWNNDLANRGDTVCSPYHWFPELRRGREVLLNDICGFFPFEARDSVQRGDFVILGGGGIFGDNDAHAERISSLLDRTPNVISWACGHNNFPGVSKTIDTSKFLRLTVRDWGYPTGERWLPDASCMMPGLSQRRRKTRHVGVVQHAFYPIDDFHDLPRIDQRHDIDCILEFISGFDAIITNSYHAAYWAVLMERKTVVWKPHSNKYDYYKHKPVLYSGDLERNLAEARTYPDALEECRRMNRAFAHEVLDLMEYTDIVASVAANPAHHKYPHWLINLLCCFVPKRANRRYIRMKYARERLRNMRI